MPLDRNFPTTERCRQPMPTKTARSSDAAAPPVERAAAGPKPSAKFRLRITVGPEIAIGPGKIALLEAIGRTGSITAAAKSLDMSYRRAWMLLDQLNGSLRRPAVDSAKGGPNGGGSALTAVGEQIILLYRRIEATAESAARTDMKALLLLLAR
jgi:molybdate transport system regulatory protein